jgi:hypothetical protein
LGEAVEAPPVMVPDIAPCAFGAMIPSLEVKLVEIVQMAIHSGM